MEMEYFRRIKGIIRKDKIKNQEVKDKLKVNSVFLLMKEAQWIVKMVSTLV